MMSKRFLVTGRVQGVGYRFFTASIATENGLRGFVRNLPDGSVEVVAEGHAESLGALKIRLEQGPPFSSVERVFEQDDYVTDEQWNGFEIR